MPKHNNITLKDIAQAVGVSRTLVSVCLSGRYKAGGYRISEATAQKVRDYAASVGYVANTGASLLRRSGQPPVGLLLSQNYGEAKHIGAINTALNILEQENREALLIGFRSLVTAIKRLKGAGVRDFIIFGTLSEVPSLPGDQKLIKELKPLLQGMRGFAIDYNFGLPGEQHELDIYRFGINRSLLMKELFDTYRRIGKDGFMSMDWYPVNHLLEAGYFSSREFIQPYNLDSKSSDTDWRNIGKKLAERFLAMRSQHPVKLIFAGDFIAGGLIAELRKNKVRIPEDVEVVGFDNLPHGEWFQVPLTSFGSPILEHTLLALDDILEKNPAPRTLLVPPQISWRSSTQLPPEEILRLEKALNVINHKDI
ncbi:MAG: LacI family transcriptional regulator [Lentisphaerae bacterium]|nr:LacI family transcriptional regulator [Lentisphaerota bacterium]